MTLISIPTKNFKYKIKEEKERAQKVGLSLAATLAANNNNLLK